MANYRVECLSAVPNPAAVYYFLYVYLSWLTYHGHIAILNFVFTIVIKSLTPQ